MFTENMRWKKDNKLVTRKQRKKDLKLQLQAWHLYAFSLGRKVHGELVKKACPHAIIFIISTTIICFDLFFHHCILRPPKILTIAISIIVIHTRRTISITITIIIDISITIIDIALRLGLCLCLRLSISCKPASYSRPAIG